jgi:hypothetical protein
MPKRAAKSSFQQTGPDVSLKPPPGLDIRNLLHADAAAATLDSDGHPVRFVTALQPGQTAKLSTPGALGEMETAIEFRRDGDRVFVDEHRRPSRSGEAASDRRAASAE